MKVALVHDYLVQYGGAERVLQEFSNMFPEAPIYTLVYDAASCGYAFENRSVHTSFLQKIPKANKTYRMFPLAMPIAVESFDFSDYDLVISSSAAFAKGIVTGENTLHITYCHTPMRFAWFDYKKITGDTIYPSVVSKTIPFFLPYMRIWDRQSAQRPDAYLCNSNFVKKKIKKYYGRDAQVLHPPLNYEKFKIADKRDDDYFLLVGRMVPYKRFDIAISAFNQLKLPLKIIGDGPEMKRLRGMAGNTVEFLGLVSEERLIDYYANAQALIFPQEEDFGITALESMASGRPVIAYRSGGATESVKEGESGIFFNEQEPQSLVCAVKQFQKTDFDAQSIRESVKSFSRNNFRRDAIMFVREKLRDYHKLIRT